MLDQVIRNSVAQLWFDIRSVWPSVWPYVIGFSVFVIGGVILQIIMIHRGGPSNRLPPGFNRLVGSLTRLLIIGLLLFLGYLIFGPKVIDEVWFWLFGAIAFPLTGFLLRKVGFWYY